MRLPALLLEWYDGIRRPLPWRTTRDPYRIWVSEVMLQQTRVETVVPYYEAFVERFPSVQELAVAPLDEVLAMWSGLGYYRRARQLHQAARRVAALATGFPSSSRELLELPGIGPYTAAAIASMAFDEMVPVLDGNVERVLCRRLGLAEDPKRSVVRRRLLAAASQLLHRARPGDCNQALMELGATVCRPKRPFCGGCPLREDCRGRLEGDPERYPLSRRRRVVERIDLVVAVTRRRGRVLLFRRPEASELLAGIWELPTVGYRARLVAVERELAGRYGGRWELEACRCRLRHSITHRALTLHVHPARFYAGDEIREGLEAAWVSEKERADFPASSMLEKVLTSLSPQSGEVRIGGREPRP